MAIERAVVHGDISGVVQIENIFTCDVEPSGGDTSQVLWAAYLEGLYTEVKSVISENVHFPTYDLYNLVSGHWVLFDTIDFDVTGEVTGEQLLNAAAAVLIGKATGLRHVGRKFFGALAEGNVSGNVFTGTALPYLAGALLNYITEFTGIGGGVITPGVTDASFTFHPFVGGVVSSLLGTMRRRKPGVGI